MAGRVTHDQARKALEDPQVPVEEALKMFDRAYRRSNDATRGFVLHFCGIVRTERIKKMDPA